VSVIRIPVRCNHVEHTVVVPFGEGPPPWFSVGIEQRLRQGKSRIASHREKTIVAAITLMVAHSLRSPNLLPLDKKQVWKLLEKANPAALRGWKSFMPRSAFDIQLCECLRGWDQRRVS
jgi:hypothetical protein